MRTVLLWLCTVATAWAGWKTALPGWKYEFPRDHGSHNEFKTEWWYFTGNLSTADGRDFGYQLTFFRQGVRSPEDDMIPLSRFVTRDIKFAHFALSDSMGKSFRFFQKISRGAYGEAGFDSGSRLAWIDDWSCELTGSNQFRLRANAEDISLDLRLEAAKPAIIHGANGVSQKAEGAGRASHYYSFTKLASQGALRVGDKGFAVSGQSWFDHEWATNQLASNQVGWDWFSLQFDDGSELMIFQLRDGKGGRDRHSAGTFVDATGVATSIGCDDFSLKPGKNWLSPATGANYPIEWQIVIPRLELKVDIRPVLPDQELRLKPISYWEGAVRASGERGKHPIAGKGFLEMTGYAGQIIGLHTGE